MMPVPHSARIAAVREDNSQQRELNRIEELEQQLKACPFCGEKAAYFEYPEMTGVIVECDHCGAKAGANCFEEEDAARQWNRRV